MEAGRQKRLAILDLETREVVTRLPPDERGVVCAAFSPREALLAFCTEPGPGREVVGSTLNFWKAERREVSDQRNLAGQCIGLAFSEDGGILVTACRNPDQLTLWRVDDRRELATWPAGGGTTFRPDFAVDKHCSVAAFRSPGGLRLLDLASGEDRWPAITNVSFTCLAFSPDGRVLASGGSAESDGIRFWAVATGKQIGEALRSGGPWVREILFFPDGKTLAATSADQTIRLWDVSDLTQVRLKGRPFRGHTLEVYCLAALPDNRTLVSGSKDGEVCLWDTVGVRSEAARVVGRGPVFRWCFSPDGKSVLTCDREGRIARWHGDEFQEVTPLFQVPLTVVNLEWGACFSDDGRRFAAGSNGVVQVWDVQRQTVVQQFWSGADSGAPWRFPNHGRRLITLSASAATEGSVDRLWDLTPEPVQAVHAWTNRALAFGAVASPDERWWVRLSQEGMCSIRDLLSGGERNQQLDINQARHPAISPDGKLFAVPSWDNLVRVWNTDAWEPVKTLRGFLLSVEWAAFSAEGGRLMTGCVSQDAVRLWDTTDWHQVLTLPAPGGWYRQIQFSPNGNTLGAVLNEVRLWPAPSWQEIEVAEAARAPAR